LVCIGKIRQSATVSTGRNPSVTTNCNLAIDVLGNKLLSQRDFFQY